MLADVYTQQNLIQVLRKYLNNPRVCVCVCVCVTLPQGNCDKVLAGNMSGQTHMIDRKVKRLLLSTFAPIIISF